VNAHVAFRVYDHGQGREVPELCDVLSVAATSSLILNHLEGRGRSGVIDAQGIRSLCIGGCDRKVASDEKVGGGQIAKAMKPGRCGEVTQK
jgi:hypothetical protein